MSNSAQTSAMDRVMALLDENSFVEIGASVTKRNTDFNLQEKSLPGDGVVTGYGVIDGSLVYVYSQDAKTLGGSIGEMHAKKITAVYDMAMKMGAPVIGLVDCSGLRLEEATDALAGFGSIYQKQALASGVIPQITAVFGTCGGGSAVSAALTDFTFVEKESGKLFVNSPNAIAGNYEEKCDTASAQFQAEAGNADFVETEETIYEKIRELVSILPSNNEEAAFGEGCEDDLNRLTENFEAEVKDPALALADLSDDNFFLEVKKDYAKEMVTGFICLNGMTIGAIANRAELLDEEGKTVENFDSSLTVAGCKKAAEMVEFCDAFQIPVLTLTAVDGYCACKCGEKHIAKASAKLTYAFANATVPKVNVIVGKAFGSAYITMNSKHIGADMVYALPNAQIGMMEADLAAKIMYDGASAQEQEKKAAEYASLQSSPEAAAKRGYVDSIIEPESVRKHLLYTYEMLYSKRESRPSKKHGTV